MTSKKVSCAMKAKQLSSGETFAQLNIELIVETWKRNNSASRLYLISFDSFIVQTKKYDSLQNQQTLYSFEITIILKNIFYYIESQIYFIEKSNKSKIMIKF